jgi:hypothetical protein
LSGPEHQTIWVNPEEIVSIRAPRDSQSEHFGPEVRCILQTVDGKLIAITDDCDAARHKIGLK